MRGKPRHIVLLLLAFSLLTGSVGQAATQRFCLMLGVGMAASAEQMEEMGCCAKAQKPECPEAAAKVSKKECCAEATTYHKLEVESNLKLTKLEMPLVFPALTNSFLLPPVALAPVVSNWPFYSDSSPPLAGRDLLHRLHILNI